MKALYFKYDKYIPYTDYDINSAEEVLEVLKKQAELVERRGLSLTQNVSQWMDASTQTAINHIFQDRLTPYHDHNYYEINYVRGGELVQYIEGMELVMKPGELVIMPPGVRHASFPVHEDNKSLNILITEAFIKKTEKLLSTVNPSNYLNYLMNHRSYILFVNTNKINIDELITEYFSYNPNETQYCELLKNNLIEKMLLSLSECERYDQIFKDAGSGVNDTKERAERILQYMYEHYADITLEDLAKKFGYSTQHIRRIIKNHTGYSFITALQQKRFERAMTLLRDTNLTIKEIAEGVGLESPEYFTRRFKFERNITPTEYRKQAMAKKDSKDKEEG